MTNRTIASLTIALCLATTSLSPAKASTSDPELYFYPKLKWTVERVSAASDENLPTCTLSNQLNNGYIVQIAGNANGFNNLNIDFRQDVFKKDFKYEVQYSVPGITTEIIPTKAFRKNLLVSDLRERKNFAQGLQTASVIDIAIQDNKFRMYLTGLETAMKGYKDCVKVPAQKVALQDGTIEMSPDKEPESRSEPIEINIEHDNRAAPPPKINITKNQVSAEPAVLDPNKMRPEPSNKPRYTEILEEKMKQESEKYKPATTEETKESIKEKSASSEPEAAAKVNTANAKEEMAKNNVEHKSTKRKENFKSPEVKYNVSKNAEPIVADFTKQESQHKNPENIEPASGLAGDEFIQMRDKLATLEKQVNTLSSENSMLNEELEIALQAAEKENLSVASNNWNLEMATMKFNEAERQIMRLGRQLKSHRAACQQEKSELERMLFDPQLTNQQQLAKLTSLESELDKTQQELERQKRHYEERVKILEAQLSGL